MKHTETTQRVVGVSVGVCHYLGTSNNGFETSLFGKQTKENVLLLSQDKMEAELEKFMSPTLFRRNNKVSLMGLLASQLCKDASKLDLGADKDDIGVIICNTYGGVASSRDFINSALTAGYKNASPLIFPNSVPNAATGIMTMQLGVRGFNTTISGFNPVAYGFEVLRQKKAKAVFAGGIEEIIPEMTEANEMNFGNPHYIRPMADGAAVVLLCSHQFALENNLNVLFEICGTASQFNFHALNTRIDNFSFISVDSIHQVMIKALQKAGTERENIDVIISLAGSQSDQKEAELEAVKRIWPENVPCIFYPKDQVGETFGASDTLSTVSACYYFRNNGMKGGYALVNSYQVGGNITSLLLNVFSQS